MRGANAITEAMKEVIVNIISSEGVFAKVVVFCEREYECKCTEEEPCAVSVFGTKYLKVEDLMLGMVSIRGQRGGFYIFWTRE